MASERDPERTDDDGSTRGAPAGARRPVSRTEAASAPGRPIVAALVALGVGAVATYGGLPLGLPIAIIGALIVAAVAFGGVYALSRGHAIAGVLTSLIATGMTLYCVITGYVMRAAAPYLTQETLEPLAVADRRYLRHPTLGFLIQDPGEAWRENNALAGIMRLGWSLVGDTRGAWGWSDDEHGAWIVVLALHLPDSMQVDGGSDVDQVGAMLRGIVTGSVREGGSTPSADEDDYFQRDDARHEAWIRSEGMRNGGVAATSGRAILWPAEQGGNDALVVMVSSHPEDDWTSFLLYYKVPHESWQGPGAAPPGFTPAATTLAQARAAYTTALTRPLRVESGPLRPVAGSGFELTHYDGPLGPLAAYATVTTSAPPCAGLLWVNQVGYLHEEIAPGSVAHSVMSLGGAVLVPTLRGEVDNPGTLELFDGEVDDVVAGVRALSQRTGLHPERIVVAGTGIGGTLALLAAETGTPAGAYVAFGAVDDDTEHAMSGPLADGPVFEVRRVEEIWIRSPIHFLAGIHAPTFGIWGDITGTLTSAPRDAIAAALPRDVPLTLIVRPDSDAALANVAVPRVFEALCAGTAPALDPATLAAPLTGD
jgi:dienelactone hydrolase